MDPFDKQMHYAQFRYDMHYDQPEDDDDSDADDYSLWDDIEEEEREGN